MMESIGKPQKHKETSARLRLTNEANLKLLVKDIKVSGKENVAEIPKDAKVVIMSTHMTDMDMLIALHALAKDLDIAIINLSVHHKFFGKQGEASTNIGLHIAGKDNFIPLDYERLDSGKKAPQTFNPDNFIPAAQAMDKGKAILIAAHNPSQTAVQSLDNIGGGYGGVYLALTTGAYILPVTTVLDKSAGMYEANLGILKDTLNKPNASVEIGKPFKLQKIEGLENLSRLIGKMKNGERLEKSEREELSRLINALRDRSEEVMDIMSVQVEKQSK